MTENGTYHLPIDIQTVDVDRSGHWLAAGWRDFLRTPRVSLIYGGAFVFASFLLTFGLIYAGLGSLVLPLAGGFVLLAPILVVGLYDVSRRLEQGADVSFLHVFTAFKDNLGQLSAMGVLLLILWFVWVEVAIVLFAIFFNQAPPPMNQFFQEAVFSLEAAPFLLIGSAFGAVIATVIFCLTAVSIPMMFDRQVDLVTAIGASILAVRANWQVMFGWAAMIVVITVAAVLSFFLGLAVALPVLAYATWHAYRDLVIAPQAPPVSDVEGFGSGI